MYTGIKERGQPATSPIVEELNLGHIETGAWFVQVEASSSCTDVSVGDRVVRKVRA